MLLQILTLCGALALYIFGMQLTSSSLQKFFGDKMRSFLPMMTSSHLKRIFSGIGLTSAVLYSTTTTAMAVSLVSAGILTLSQAAGFIMGANIGTTITLWIVATLGFAVKTIALGFPFLLVGFLLGMGKKSSIKTLGHILTGFAFVFLGVYFMSSAAQTINQVPELVFFSNEGLLAGSGLGAILAAFILGFVATQILRTSNATLTTVLLFALMNWISIECAAATVAGANIGSAIVTWFNSSKYTTEAKQAAFIHVLFNVVGAILFLPLIIPVTRLSAWIVGGATTPLSMIFAICLMHTIFNVITTLILAWFEKPLANLAIKTVPAEVVKEKTNTRLKFIKDSNIGPAAISLTLAHKEIRNFGEITLESYGFVKKAINENDPDKFEEIRMKLVEYENITDMMEHSIADYLNSVSSSSLSSDEAREVKSLYRIISELESVGDSCDNIGRILNRERAHNRLFDEELISKVNKMYEAVRKSYKVMLYNMSMSSDGLQVDLQAALAAEKEINELRNTLRNEAIQKIDNHSGNYQSVNYFLDILSELEAMGDFIINISQALGKCFDK